MDQQHDEVELRIPRKPEYVSVARLAVSGIAARMEFSYDEVEDIKLAVGEACTNAIQEMVQANEIAPLTLRCVCEPDLLRIEVIHPKASRRQPPDEESISRMLMEVLVDEVEEAEDGAGNLRVAMVKYAARNLA